MPRLSLALLGSFQATLDGIPLTGFESNKVRALLAYLAVERHRPHARDDLSALLWPDHSARSALVNLRNALYALRNVLRDREAVPPFLEVSNDTLQFNNASDHTLDLATFQMEVGALVRKGEASSDQQSRDLASAIALYRGPFMHGFHVDDSPPFEEWLFVTGEQINRQMVTALRYLAREEEQLGNYGEARRYVRHHLELEPWDEDAHRRLMRLLALEGRRNAALSQYRACCRTLGDELRLGPSAATTALYERIRRGEVGAEARWEPGRSTPEPPASTSSQTFVGREQEMARLNQLLERALAGQGQVAFVAGEAGSGKTTLLQAFANRALDAHEDVLVTVGACSAQCGIGDPCLPFREMVQLLAGDAEPTHAATDLTGELASRAWANLPLVAQTLLEEGPELIDSFLPARGLLVRLEGLSPSQASLRRRLERLIERRATRGHPHRHLQGSALFAEVTQVLLTLAEGRPLVLVVDDLQWVDADSASLLLHLGRRLADSRVLLIGAYRPCAIVPGDDGEPHPLSSVLRALGDGSGDAQIRLGETDGRRLVDALVDMEPNRLDDAFRRALHRHAGANPLFVTEFMRDMQERGDLVQDEQGRWITASGVPGPGGAGELDWQRLPARVEAVVAERVERLPAAWQELLEVASVEGRTFTAEVVARVQGRDERQIVEWLRGPLSSPHRLVRARDVEPGHAQRPSRYRFRHTLFQSYVYRKLDRVERARLHEAVRAALMTVYRGQLADLSETLARHARAAGVRPQEGV